MAKTNVGDLGLRDKKALKINVFSPSEVWQVCSLRTVTPYHSDCSYSVWGEVILHCAAVPLRVTRWNMTPLGGSFKRCSSFFLSLLKCWPHMYIRVEKAVPSLALINNEVALFLFSHTHEKLKQKLNTFLTTSLFEVFPKFFKCNTLLTMCSLK